MSELVVKLPPSSASASSTPRALFRSLAMLPKHCMRKGWKKKKKKNDDDDGEDEEFVGPTSALVEEEFTSPSHLVVEEEKEEEKEEGGGKKEEGFECGVVSSSGKKPEVSFNQGIGVGLVFLLVKSATEFNKMIELRKQMEFLLRDMKGELKRKKSFSCSYSESNNVTVLSASNCWGDEVTSNPTSLQTAGCTVFDAQCKCETLLEKERCLKINQLEEELESELERLQIKAEEGLELRPQQQGLEILDLNDLKQEEDEEEEEEEEERKEVRTGGVCARELERRLHELLETRQQERIAELETALEYAERKFHEKEMEISWWQDTARLVSKHKER